MIPGITKTRHPMRFHVLGLPHTAINKEYNCCAYSQKILKFAAMMVPRGHQVTLYSNEGADVPCENVEIFSEKERQRWFGPHDTQKLYDLIWTTDQPYWERFNDRCIEALRPRVKKGDFILTASGGCSLPVGVAFPGSFSGIQQTVALVEAFCGYYGTFSRYRVFESHAHREWLMGSVGNKGEDNDTAVVPNYWDMKDFEPVPSPDSLHGIDLTKPYYLFVGRVIHEKGWAIASEVTATLGARLIIAGQGDPGALSPHVEFFGYASTEERNILMQHAVACFCPTRFREPFGGTAAESQLCGTPAITTDQGAFTETVEDRWRCASHREFVHAAEVAMELDIPEVRAKTRARAVSKWSFEAVAPRYEAYFQRLLDRWGSGWYQTQPYVMPEEP